MATPATKRLELPLPPAPWSDGLVAFFDQVAELKDRLEVWEVTAGAVQEYFGGRNWKAAPWASDQGVYLFLTGDHVHYVGRALRSFRQRLRSQVKGGLEEKEWGTVVFAEGARILVIPLRGELSDWAASLEVRLHRLLNPTSGRRRG